jgi:hypothetical protein
MAKKIRVWDGSAWQDVAPALPYTAVHSAQASMPSTAVDGQIWLDTDASVPSTTVTRWYKLPSAGTTTLSGNDDNSIPLAYTPGYEQVFLNGTLLSRSAADYTATTGTSVVLSSAIVAGDIVEIICPLQITTTDTYTQSATNAAFQANTNNFAAGKNKIINGDFGINQRNLTSTTSVEFGFDRWISAFSGATGTYSAQTFTPGTAPVSGYEGKNFARLAVTVGNDNCRLQTTIEDVRTFAGQTVTLSFWAKGTNPTTAGSLMALLLQDFGTGGSPSTQIRSAEQTVTLTSNWTRYSYTFSLPSMSGKTFGTNNNHALYVWVGQGANTSTEAWTLDLWGVQLEAGSTATAFQTATGTLQGELAACQRYYVRWGGTGAYEFIGLGTGATSTIASISVMLPVQMRIAPTTVDYSTLGIFDGTAVTGSAVPTIVSSYTGTKVAGLDATVASGVTVNRPYRLITNNSTSGYLGLSAEL